MGTRTPQVQLPMGLALRKLPSPKNTRSGVHCLEGTRTSSSGQNVSAARGFAASIVAFGSWNTKATGSDDRRTSTRRSSSVEGSADIVPSFLPHRLVALDGGAHDEVEEPHNMTRLGASRRSPFAMRRSTTSVAVMVSTPIDACTPSGSSRARRHGMALHVKHDQASTHRRARGLGRSRGRCPPSAASISAARGARRSLRARRAPHRTGPPGGPLQLKRSVSPLPLIRSDPRHGRSQQRRAARRGMGPLAAPSKTRGE
jgi:hypothetical protein